MVRAPKETETKKVKEERPVMSLPEILALLQDANQNDQPTMRLMEEEKAPLQKSQLELDELADILWHVNNTDDADIKFDEIARMAYRDKSKEDLDPLRPFDHVSFSERDIDGSVSTMTDSVHYVTTEHWESLGDGLIHPSEISHQKIL
jgi:hypothetical protein